MTKVQVQKLFKEVYEDQLIAFKNDRVMKVAMWHDFTDKLCKDGDITPNQYNSWTNPYHK